MSVLARGIIFFICLLPCVEALAETKSTALPLPRDIRSLKQVSVSLKQNVPVVQFQALNPFEILDSWGGEVLVKEPKGVTSVRAEGDELFVGEHRFTIFPVTVDTGDGVKIDNRTYGHLLRFWPEKDNTVTVVNVIDVEEYLKGVLPWEANPKWNIEVLKAQAVASRTYALFNAIDRKDERFVMTDNVLSQVYAGESAKKKKTNEAVELTRGQILTYKGKIFSTYFHSTCAGATTHAEYLWDVKPHHSLSGVLCPHCRTSKHFKWDASFPGFAIQQTLKERGFEVGEIEKIIPSGIDVTGRAKYFVIEHSKGSEKIHSNDFRLWMGPATFKSTLIESLKRDGMAFRFQGKGWGHGVGMCQYGAKRLAELGYDYTQILEFYYPGAKVRQLKL